MADPLSIAASIIGVAAAGIKLSSTIYNYTDAALQADKHVKEIARDLSLTSTVIRELGRLLSQHDGSDLFSEDALHTANAAIVDCDVLFKEIQKELDKHLDYEGEDKVKRVSRYHRLRWPLVEPKMHSLQARLERLKNTLSLMLNIANYASRSTSNDTSSSIIDPDAQQRQIERLILLSEETHARYNSHIERLLRKLESSSSRHSRTPSPHPKPQLETSPCMSTAITKPARAPSISPSTNNCLCGSSVLSTSTTFSSTFSRTSTLLSRQSTCTSRNSFHMSPEELESATEAAKSLLSVLEDAKSIHSTGIRCENVRQAYSQSVQSLGSIMQPEYQAPKRSRLQRIFSKRP